MKTMIFSVLMLFSTAYAGAEEARYLTVTTATQEKSVELATVQKITFTADNIIVHTTAGEISFPLSETEKMSFTATPASIGALPLQAEGLQYVNGQLIVHTPGLLRIYDAAGTLITTFPAVKDAVFGTGGDHADRGESRQPGSWHVYRGHW